MIICADKYISTTIPELIAELERDPQVIEWVRAECVSGDTIEAIATHIVMTDTDWIESNCEDSDATLAPLPDYLKITMRALKDKLKLDLI